MSRSYKKNPFVTDHKCGTTKDNKRIANRIVRRRVNCLDEDMPARLQHKKMTESWDICDYKWYSTKEEAIEWYLHNCDNDYIKKKYPTLKRYLNYWEKCCRRK